MGHTAHVTAHPAEHRETIARIADEHFGWDQYPDWFEQDLLSWMLGFPTRDGTRLIRPDDWPVVKGCVSRNIRWADTYAVGSPLPTLDGTPGRVAVGYSHQNPDGTLGGFVEWSAFVGRDVHLGLMAAVTDQARVVGQVRVLDTAKIGDRAVVTGCCTLNDHVRVSGSAVVSGAVWLSGSVTVSGNAVVTGTASLAGTEQVAGDTVIDR